VLEGCESAAGHQLGWQPSRFLTDRAEAERAFAVAEQLGSINAAAAELDTTWPSLRKAFTRHGLGIPARNPQAARQRATAAARQRTGQTAVPALDPVFVALNPGALPTRRRSQADLYQWVRREEQYATLGASVVVELYSESRARKPTTRAWAIIRRAERAHRHTSDRQGRGERRQADRVTRSDAPADPTNLRSGGWLPMPADPTTPRRALDAGGQLLTHPEGRIARVINGLCRTKESRAWPGTPILIHRGGRRPWGSYQGSA
jgi:hypothetical protein